MVLVGTILLFTRVQKGGRLILATSILLLGCVVSPLAPSLGSQLEKTYRQPPEVPLQVRGAILLGGSFDREAMVGQSNVVYSLAAGRLLDFARLVKKYPHLKFAFSGGGQSFQGIPSEASLARKILYDLGIDISSIVFEDHSKNTFENAKFSYKVIRPKPGEKWFLVTSALHMPRAVALFRKAGWDVMPYPVDYHVATPKFLNTPARGFFYWRYVFHELGGMMYSYFSGEVEEFWPKT